MDDRTLATTTVDVGVRARGQQEHAAVGDARERTQLVQLGPLHRTRRQMMRVVIVVVVVVAVRVQRLGLLL